MSHCFSTMQQGQLRWFNHAARILESNVVGEGSAPQTKKQPRDQLRTRWDI